MGGVVLDSSALLALINKEPGYETVKDVLPNAVMSGVNLAEIVSILSVKHGLAKNTISTMMGELVKEIISFDEEQAYIVGEIEKINFQEKLGLSLGDKACLSLGKLLHYPVYTAEKIWEKLKVNNVDIELIR